MVKITVEEIERMAAETAEAEIDAAEDSVVWSYDDFVNNRQGAIKADAVRRARDAKFAAVLKRRNRRDAIHNS
jgi:hypothetical protein